MAFKKYIIFLFAGLAACHPVRQHYSVNPVSETKATPDQTASYVFKIVGNSKGPSTISLVSQSLTTGKLKSNGDPTVFPSRLAITQVDGSSKVVDIVSLEHPLFRMTEFITDQNSLNRKLSAATQAEFLVRLPWRSMSSTLQIEEFKEGKSLGKTMIELK